MPRNSRSAKQKLRDRAKVMIVVNKWWECDPILEVLLNPIASPQNGLSWPSPLNYPRPRPPAAQLPPEDNSPLPRAVFSLSRIDVEVWCISDLMEHLPDTERYQSSSQRKVELMPKMFHGGMVELVIAAGTASWPGIESHNGCVTAGTRVFMYNAHPNGENPDSDCRTGPFDTIVDSSLKESTFDRIVAIDRAPDFNVRKRMLFPPLNSARCPELIAAAGYVALSDINVTNYAEYDFKDRATLDTFTKKNPGLSSGCVGSLETTHALIRMQSESPFMFVSGITDRVGFFKEEVGLRTYAQNFCAAHNIGIVLAWMLPEIDQWLSN